MTFDDNRFSGSKKAHLWIAIGAAAILLFVAVFVVLSVLNVNPNDLPE